MNKYFKNYKIYVFFVIAFTLTFLAFSMGKSALNSQKQRVAKYNGEDNKLVGINSSYELTSEELIQLLKEKKVSIQLNYYNDVTNGGFLVTTNIKGDSFSRLDDLRYGNYLTNDQYLGNELIGVYSTGLTNDKEFELKYKSKNAEIKSITIKENGKTFSPDISIDVPNNLFYQVAGSDKLNGEKTSVIISGDGDEINKTIFKLESFLKNKDANSKLEITKCEVLNKGDAGNQFFNAAVLIIVITILNSIAITSLWVEKNKKELVVRKVCGAKDRDLLVSFFGRLIPIAIFSVVLAILLQLIVSYTFNGLFLNFDIRIKLNNILYSMLVSFGVAFLASIPALYYISKVQPANLLKEE